MFANVTYEWSLSKRLFPLTDSSMPLQQGKERSQSFLSLFLPLQSGKQDRCHNMRVGGKAVFRLHATQWTIGRHETWYKWVHLVGERGALMTVFTQMHQAVVFVKCVCFIGTSVSFYLILCICDFLSYHRCGSGSQFICFALLGAGSLLLSLSCPTTLWRDGSSNRDWSGACAI